MRHKLHAAPRRLPQLEDKSDRQTSRGASMLLKIASGAREGPRVCQVHIYQQAGLKEIDDKSIEQLK